MIRLPKEGLAKGYLNVDVPFPCMMVDLRFMRLCNRPAAPHPDPWIRFEQEVR